MNEEQSPLPSDRKNEPSLEEANTNDLMSDSSQESRSVQEHIEDAARTQEAPLRFRVVLASNSPRRKELLEDAGVRFIVRPPLSPVDESLDADLMADPAEACKKIAERKAATVVQEILSEPFQGMDIVIGADTMVVKDGRIFGKPKSLSDAKHMLRALAGSTHEVLTGVSVWLISAPEEDNISLGFRTLVDRTYVTFKDLTDEEIAEYLRMGESFDKAGAYGIQGKAGEFVTNLSGSLDTVIGLPVERLLREFPDLRP